MIVLLQNQLLQGFDLDQLFLVFHIFVYSDQLVDLCQWVAFCLHKLLDLFSDILGEIEIEGWVIDSQLQQIGFEVEALHSFVFYVLKDVEYLLFLLLIGQIPIVLNLFLLYLALIVAGLIDHGLGIYNLTLKGSLGVVIVIYIQLDHFSFQNSLEQLIWMLQLEEQIRRHSVAGHPHDIIEGELLDAEQNLFGVNIVDD